MLEMAGKSTFPMAMELGLSKKQLQTSNFRII